MSATLVLMAVAYAVVTARRMPGGLWLIVVAALVLIVHLTRRQPADWRDEDDGHYHREYQ